MKSRIQFLYALLAFLAAEAIQYFTVICFCAVYSIWILFKKVLSQGGVGSIKSTDIAKTIEEAMSQDILYLISVIAVIICGIVFFFWYRYEIKGEARGSIRSTFTSKNVMLLILMGIGCQLFVSGMMSIIQQYFVQLFTDYGEQIKSLTSGNTIVVLCLLFFVAPIAEELIFRGIILHKASRAIPFLGANLLQAMLFGIYHMNVIQGIYAVIIGFLLGLVYHRFKTIFAPMLLHMVINASSFLIFFVPDNNLGFYTILLIGGVLTIAALYFIKITKPVVLEQVSYPAQFQQPNFDQTNQD